jgi:hypothetical protein
MKLMSATASSVPPTKIGGNNPFETALELVKPSSPFSGLDNPTFKAWVAQPQNQAAVDKFINNRDLPKGNLDETVLAQLIFLKMEGKNAVTSLKAHQILNNYDKSINDCNSTRDDMDAYYRASSNLDTIRDKAIDLFKSSAQTK